MHVCVSLGVYFVCGTHFPKKNSGYDPAKFQSV